jgi:hypothetical protein
MAGEIICCEFTVTEYFLTILLLACRYQIQRNDGADVVEGVDKLSRSPKNQKVIIFIFQDQTEYNRLALSW